MSLAWTHYPDSELTHCSYSLMLRAMRKKNNNANVIVFGLIQSGLKHPCPTTLESSTLTVIYITLMRSITYSHDVHFLLLSEIQVVTPLSHLEIVLRKFGHTKTVTRSLNPGSNKKERQLISCLRR